MKTLIIAASVFAGCLHDYGPGPEQEHERPSNARYLCVGMESSARFGDCPGCRLDATRISNLMRDRFGYGGDMLISGEATKDEVCRKLGEGIDSTPEDGLFLFFYSGHGGQEYLGGKEPDGSDRMDEYLCLYDTHMLDDEIWDIVSRCKGRVFMYFDACHSATMYRSVASSASNRNSSKKANALSADTYGITRSSGFTFRTERMIKAMAHSVNGGRVAYPRILCWSGCKEQEYSYGGSDGGTLTIAVACSWKKGISYDELWKSAVKLVGMLQTGQHPVQTFIGDGFKGVEAFK